MKLPNPMNLYRFVKAMWYFRHRIDHSGSFDIDGKKILKVDGNFDYIVMYMTFEDLPKEYQVRIKERARTYTMVIEQIDD